MNNNNKPQSQPANTINSGQPVKDESKPNEENNPTTTKVNNAQAEKEEQKAKKKLRPEVEKFNQLKNIKYKSADQAGIQEILDEIGIKQGTRVYNYIIGYVREQGGLSTDGKSCNLNILEDVINKSF